MMQGGSYDIQIDTDRNRLYIILRGFLSDAEMQIAREKIIENVKKLSKSFDVVTDISTFKPASAQGVKEFKQAQRYLASHGMRRMVQVVSNDGLAALQISRTAKGIGYAANTVSSVIEADEKLEG